MKSEPDCRRLRQIVASYGADPRRWPEDERRTLADAAKRQAGSDWMEEARALDHVLDRGLEGSVPAGLDGDLAGAILARAAKTPQIRAQGRGDDRTVVDFVAPANIGIRRTSGRFAGFTGYLPEAAVLAASLLIGIWAGGNDVLNTELLEFGMVAGLSGSTEDEINFISALVGFDLIDNEDLL